MKDTIKMLKEQATSYSWDGGSVTEELDEEKFAELIIRHCADYVYFKAEKSMDRELVHVGNDMLDYFGLER